MSRSDDLHLFKEWSDAAVLPLGGLLSEEEREACAYKYAEMQHYFAARIAERRDDPQDDMLTDMVAARLEGERPLDVPELLSICAQFLVAGNETTTKLITACVQLLCQHPDQLAAVRDDPVAGPGRGGGVAPDGVGRADDVPHRHARHRAGRRGHPRGRPRRAAHRRRQP